MDIADIDESCRIKKMKPLDECNVGELRTLLKERNLAASGTRAELLLRLREAGVTGKTARASQEEIGAEGGCEQPEVVSNVTGEVTDAASAIVAASIARKEAELYRRERESSSQKSWH